MVCEFSVVTLFKIELNKFILKFSHVTNTSNVNFCDEFVSLFFFLV